MRSIVPRRACVLAFVMEVGRRLNTWTWAKEKLPSLDAFSGGSAKDRNVLANLVVHAPGLVIEPCMAASWKLC